MPEQLLEWLFGTSDKFVTFWILFSLVRMMTDGHFMTHIRGGNLLVLRFAHVRTFPWSFRRSWLGLEQVTHSWWL